MRAEVVLTLRFIVSDFGIESVDLSDQHAAKRLALASKVAPVRVLYAGASNFRVALSPIWKKLQGTFGVCHVTGICGHGRSYCGPSGFGLAPLRRILPGIADCVARHIAPDTAALEQIPVEESQFREGGSEQRSKEEPCNEHLLSAAIFGDFGNDLAYGASAGAILGAFQACLGVLPANLPIVVVLPPAKSVAALDPRLFSIVTKLVFPGRGVRREPVLKELARLDRGLRRLCRDQASRMVAVEAPADWYGWDGIHIRRAKLDAWANMLCMGLVGLGLVSRGARRGERGGSDSDGKWSSGSSVLGADQLSTSSGIPLLSRWRLWPQKFSISILGSEREFEVFQPCFEELVTEQPVMSCGVNGVSAEESTRQQGTDSSTPERRRLTLL